MTAPDSPALEQFGYRQEPKRSLGLTALVAYGLSWLIVGIGMLLVSRRTRAAVATR